MPHSGHWRSSRPQSRLYQLCGTSESDHADEYAPLHSIDQCLLQEGRESRGRCRIALHALQFLPYPSDIEGNPSYGSGNRRPCLEHRRDYQSHFYHPWESRLAICSISSAKRPSMPASNPEPLAKSENVTRLRGSLLIMKAGTLNMWDIALGSSRLRNSFSTL